MAIAQEPTKWTMPLGVNADANSIPDTTLEYTGAASMNSVFPPITQLPLEAGGIAPTRADFNGLFKLLGASIYYLQRGGIFSYADNVDYPAGAVVKFENGIYIAIQENGPTGTVADPSAPAYWRHLTTTVNNQYADSNGNISITSVTNATHATSADSATNATHATSADSATNATHATSADNGVESAGSGYMRFKNGVQICWGGGVSPVTFSKSFTGAPVVTLTHYTSSSQVAALTLESINQAGFTFIGYNITAQRPVDTTTRYMAIGTWK